MSRLSDKLNFEVPALISLDTTAFCARAKGSAMNNIRWLNGPDQSTPNRVAGFPRDDAGLLDAYSQAVVGVVEAVELAVVSVEADSGREPRGQGSGFFVTPDGYLLTNDHVAEHVGKRAVVTLSDGRRIEARVVGSDPATDLAVLRANASRCRSSRSATPKRCGPASSRSRSAIRSAFSRPFRPASSARSAVACARATAG